MQETFAELSVKQSLRMFGLNVFFPVDISVVTNPGQRSVCVFIRLEKFSDF